MENLLEALGILAHHHDVDVVIPGYKALVACRAKQRTRAQPPLDVVLVAYIRQVEQNLEQLELRLAKLRALGVETLFECLSIKCIVGVGVILCHKSP